MATKLSTHLRDIVVSSLPFLLLQLDTDSSDGTLLDPLHEMCNESSYLISQRLGRDDGHFFHDPLVGVKIKSQPSVVFFDDDSRCLFDSLCPDPTLFQ